ncbi:MAG TPA: MarR family transcriptional regulator [Terriglobia bacterium]|nr:MarR family transcriptional regulator [Terriglobia bacterium]
MTTTPRKRPTPLPLLPCACANLRRAARAVTRLYNGELQRDGIEVTQFTLLMALNKTGAIPQGALGRLLALDSTTLTRMLDLMKRRGWVQAKEGDDRRAALRSVGILPALKIPPPLRHYVYRHFHGWPKFPASRRNPEFWHLARQSS